MGYDRFRILSFFKENGHFHSYMENGDFSSSYMENGHFQTFIWKMVIFDVCQDLENNFLISRFFEVRADVKNQDGNEEDDSEFRI